MCHSPLLPWAVWVILPNEMTINPVVFRCFHQLFGKTKLFPIRSGNTETRL